MVLNFGIPKKSPHPPVFSWRPFILFGIILCVALGLRVYQWIRGPAVPTADVPAVAWEEIANEAVLADEGDVDLHEEDAVSEEPVVNEEEVEQEPSAEVDLPDAVNLAVPFVSQAPFGIWDEFTEETCEEASFLMVYEYYRGAPLGSIDPATADADFRAMVAAEESLGFGVSISTAQFVAFAEVYNQSMVRIVENPTVDDLRALLAAGNPVIIPVFGRRLGNPFFAGEGPLYHVLVLRGYTPTSFITNDPGTRHGENYQYTFDVLMNAIGDWDGDSPDGGTRVMVLEP